LGARRGGEGRGGAASFHLLFNIKIIE